MNRQEITALAFESPKAGMKFTEMYAFWVHVVEVRKDGTVVVEEYSPPCSIPDDAHRIEFKTADGFRSHYGYSTREGYWVFYVGDDAPTDHVSELRGREGYAVSGDPSEKNERAVVSRRSRARRAVSNAAGVS